MKKKLFKINYETEKVFWAIMDKLDKYFENLKEADLSNGLEITITGLKNFRVGFRSCIIEITPSIQKQGHYTISYDNWEIGRVVLDSEFGMLELDIWELVGVWLVTTEFIEDFDWKTYTGLRDDQIDSFSNKATQYLKENGRKGRWEFFLNDTRDEIIETDIRGLFEEKDSFIERNTKVLGSFNGKRFSLYMLEAEKKGMFTPIHLAGDDGQDICVYTIADYISSLKDLEYGCSIINQMAEGFTYKIVESLGLGEMEVPKYTEE